MDNQEFTKHLHAVGEWIARYQREVEGYPVCAQTRPGALKAGLPVSPPRTGEAMEAILEDFQDLVMPGITHWQHPSYFGYFPANASPPSVLAEMLTAGLGVIAFNWEASPAATELEERMMEWLRQAIGLPGNFTGVIQSTASEATLCALLTARERLCGFTTNETGLQGAGRLTAFCSDEAHSSVDKAMRIAGLGSVNLRKVPTDTAFAMSPEALEAAIRDDIEQGARPVCVIATLGATGTSGFDSLTAIGEICRRHDVWLHVDAAWAGSALVLEDCRWMIEGIEHADSFLFNPHKWLLTNFDCTAYFVRDTTALTNTLGITPEYLKTSAGDVTDFRDWGVPLGRRFRALKLWFVLRAYGLEGLQHHIRGHIAMAQELGARIEAEPDFELVVPPRLALLCFRYCPNRSYDDEHIDELNQRLLASVNASGKTYLTHARARGHYVIRFAIGQTFTEPRHVDAAWRLITSLARQL
ncbi:MAG: pyridoxal phosphate-dependent decarboxylase family protein [Sphingomonadales bacterium]